MCFTGSCQYERYSYSQEDCICKKPACLPCPMDLSDEETERINEEWDEPDDPRATQIMYDESWRDE